MINIMLSHIKNPRFDLKNSIQLCGTLCAFTLVSGCLSFGGTTTTMVDSTLELTLIVTSLSLFVYSLYHCFSTRHHDQRHHDTLLPHYNGGVGTQDSFDWQDIQL